MVYSRNFDQVAAMKPLTKWSERVYETRRIPEMLAVAFRTAISGKPGPVYLDFPVEVLSGSVEESDVVWPEPLAERPRPGADPAQVEQAIALLEGAERPVVISGSGILWSGASEAMTNWIDQTGIPFFTTPQGRGVVPEDHRLAFANVPFSGTSVTPTSFSCSVRRLNYVF